MLGTLSGRFNTRFNIEMFLHIDTIEYYITDLA
jgi:hypothetical protein